MAKGIGPQKEEFKNAQLADKILRVITLCAFAFTILMTIFEYWVPFAWVDEVSISGSIVFTALLFILSIIFSYIQNEAELERRRGLVDNAYETNMASSTSENYYDTEDIPKGTSKLLATIHENAMYTNRISKKMLKRYLPANIILIVVLIGCFILGINRVKIFDLVLQLFLSALFLMEYLNVLFLHRATKDVEQNCRDIWETVSQRNSKAFEARTIYTVIKYECAITRSGIILDSKIYEQMNEEIMKDWESCRKKYKI